MSKSQERWQLTDARSFAKHLKTLYIGAVQEIAYIFCLDTKLRVICREVIGRGVVDSVAIQERAVAEIVLRNRSSRVVLVHNHMDGSSVPSSADIYMTKQLYRMFRTMHITLEDHFIVGDRVVSMKQEGYWDEDF
jgi:DNA repair protein RadC